MLEPENSIRAFIAINLPEELKAMIEGRQRELKSKDGGQAVRWIPRRQIHLTLRFLGDVPEWQIKEIEAGLVRAATQIEPFEMRVEGIGCFPQARRPSIVWLGITETTECLNQLHRAIRDETMTYGKTDPRPFSPHLTIGRIKREHARNARRLTEAFPTNASRTLGSCRVTQVDLMRSRLLPAGADYTRLASAILAGSG